MATLTAFAVARHRAAQRAGIDVRADGLQGQPRRFVLYLGAEGHGSARKAAELLGIGSANIRTIVPPMRAPAAAGSVAAALERDLADGWCRSRSWPAPARSTPAPSTRSTRSPTSAPSTSVWLHVDGSYGGPAVLLLDRYAATRAALARVDSLALDPHKWLYTPVDAGLVLLRDAALARDAFSLVPPYLRTDDDPSGVGGPVWFSEYGFDQTRPFRALKVWLMLKHLGVAGYRDLIAHDLAVADRLAAGVAAAPDLELLAHGLASCASGAGRPAGPATSSARRPQPPGAVGRPARRPRVPGRHHRRRRVRPARLRREPRQRQPPTPTPSWPRSAPCAGGPPLPRDHEVARALPADQLHDL